MNHNQQTIIVLVLIIVGIRLIATGRLRLAWAALLAQPANNNVPFSPPPVSQGSGPIPGNPGSGDNPYNPNPVYSGYGPLPGNPGNPNNPPVP